MSRKSNLGIYNSTFQKMDWPEELLEIFDDPLLADVRPKPKAPTPDDRLAQKLLEIKAKRQDAALENMSDEDLDKALAELSE